MNKKQNKSDETNKIFEKKNPVKNRLQVLRKM